MLTGARSWTAELAVLPGSLAVGRSAVHADPPSRAHDVSNHTPEAFRDLFAKSRCGTVRVILLGDSQETSPGGAVAVYLPRLQFEFWSRIGNAPESPWMQLGVSTGGGAPWADWVWRGANIAQGLTETRLASSAVPPGLSPAKTSTTSGSNVNANQIYGNLLMDNCAAAR